MSRLPCQKGTSVAPLAQALKIRPEARALLPEALWKYLDEPVSMSAWYPERDYWVLIAALVKTMDPSTVGGDPWRYFARFSAQRDIGGQALLAGAEDTSAAGVHRNFANMTEPDSFFSAAMRLWKQYHDTGRLELVGVRRAKNSLVMRLMGFVIPLEGFVLLQGYYLEEYGKLIGIELHSAVTRSTAHGDPFCEWEYRLAPSPANDAYLASLPEVNG